MQKLDSGLMDWTVDWNLDWVSDKNNRWMATISKYRLVGIGRLCTMSAELVNKAYDTAILATNINHL